jgi:signal transduction histidine kinase
MYIDRKNMPPFSAAAWRGPRPSRLRAELRQLEPRAQAIYAQMIARLQRDMLLLLMALTIPVGVFFGAQLFYNVWIARTMPLGAFVVHTVNMLLIVSLAAFFLWRGKIAAAWASVLCASLSAVVLQIWLLHEPGLLLFAVLSMAVPAIVMRLRVSVLLVGLLVAALYTIMRYTTPAYSDAWVSIAVIFAAIMFGLGCMGIVIRRFVRQFAQATVEIEDAAAQRGKLEQRMDDLHSQINRITSLEHDLRQPLRAVQGYLASLADEAPASGELIAPAQAAAQRADRLINNLLDLAHAEAHQQRGLRTPIELAQLFATLQRTAPGLASYYTDPPVPIEFSLPDRSLKAAVDAEQLERAILNLLDNALAYSPPDGTIAVRAWAAEAELAVEVRDMGPGIPEQVVRALMAGESAEGHMRPGLGLRQVYRMAQAHGGRLSIEPRARGTTVRVTLPLAAADGAYSKVQNH